MQILLIIQELHGLARDSINGYDKVLTAWKDRPEREDIENQQVSRRVILTDLRKAIERYKGTTDTMSPSEGYQAINQRQLTGNRGEMRGTLDDLLRGENYYIYRIDDARTRFPAVAAHLTHMYATIRDNRDLLSALLAREEPVSSISIDHPNGATDEHHLTDSPEPIFGAPISSLPATEEEAAIQEKRQMLAHEEQEGPPVKTYSPVPLPTDAVMPPSFRQSAAGDSPYLDDIEEVESVEIVTGSDENLADKPELENHHFITPTGGTFIVPPDTGESRHVSDTDLDRLPAHVFDYSMDTTPPEQNDDFKDDSIDHSEKHDEHTALQIDYVNSFMNNVETNTPVIKPLDSPGNLRRNIMMKRPRFDDKTVHADANEIADARHRY